MHTSRVARLSPGPASSFLSIVIGVTGYGLLSPDEIRDSRGAWEILCVRSA
jgi:hypothetical protein